MVHAAAKNVDQKQPPGCFFYARRPVQASPAAEKVANLFL
jgi:hypothetical protein